MIVKRFNFIPNSKKRLYLGFFLGIFQAVVLYLFFYLSREAFRIVYFLQNDISWGFTAAESDFYNLFFAALAAVIGQSTCFAFWLERPSRAISATPAVRDRIMHDQRGFNWYLLSWYGSVASLFGFVVFDLEMQFDISLYTDYQFIFVLIPIVLFFQSWNTLQLRLKGARVRPMLLSGLIVGVLTIGLSQITIPNLETEDVYQKYQLELPAYSRYVDFASNSNHAYDGVEVTLVKSDKDESSQPLILLKNQVVTLDQLGATLRNSKPHPNFRGSAILIADATIEMGFVQEVAKQILANGSYYIFCGVTSRNKAPSYLGPDDMKGSFKMTSNPRWIPLKLYDHLSDSLFMNSDNPFLPVFSDTISISQNDSMFIEVNNAVFAVSKLGELLTQQIEQVAKQDSGQYLITFSFNEQLDLESYLNASLKPFEVIHDLRRSFAKSYFSKDYSELTQSDVDFVRGKYPMRIWINPLSSSSLWTGPDH